MERRGFKVPLLIGGATTSRTHTAVKIEPAYRAGPTVYVLDASRAVGVVSNLLSPTERARVVAETKAEYVRVRESYARGPAKPRAPIAEARANRFAIDWAGYSPPNPVFTGVRAFEDYDLAELAAHIDWTPFFSGWELVGRYPDILQDDIVGEAARSLHADALVMLDQIIAEKWFKASGVIGLWPANADGDDVVVYADDTRTTELARLHTLRQQMPKGEGKSNAALSDFVAPIGTKPDWIGGFAVTAGLGEGEISRAFKAKGDDYSAILASSLADRLAEAFAEVMHKRVRREFWGYAADEDADLAVLLAEKYQGIRPAPGYPAQPDHTEKLTLFDLLNAETNTGMQLTESMAMTPPASVSGLYFSHPDAHYFGVGRIARDQVEDYARRKGWSIAVAERWLSPILNYDPASEREQAA
jgi:5-methyltetrahydrofolate--homocysteine methyltransferase